MTSLGTGARRRWVPAAAAALLTLLPLGLAQAEPLRPVHTPAEIRSHLERIQELLAPLPAAKRAEAERLPMRDHTAERITAFRLYQALPEEERGPVAHLFALPGEHICLESERYPLRACFEDEGQRPKAQAMLAYGEEAWEGVVERLGFFPPRRGTERAPEMGVDLFLGDTLSHGAAGYTAPVGFDPSTPHTDCLCYIVMNEQEPAGESMAHTIRHEFNHSCALAMDCLENLAGLEGTAVWAEPVLTGHADMYFDYAVSTYQRSPNRTLGWSPQDSLHPYGAALFFKYIQEALGDGDPQTITRLWTGSTQWRPDNEPDLLDAAVELAAEHDMTLDDLLLQFAEWRYFLGRNDDGQHFVDGRFLEGAEVHVAGRMVLGPLRVLPMTARARLDPLGTWYATLRDTSGGIPDGLVTLSVAGGVRTRGLLELWLTKGGMMTQRESTLSEDGLAERIVVSANAIAGADYAFVVLVNAPEGADWDDRGSEATVEITLDALPQPTLERLEPDVLPVSSESTLTLVGAGFFAGSRAEVVGEGLTLVAQELTDDNHLRVTLRADPTATPGWRALRVINTLQDLQLEAELLQAVEVVKPPAPAPTALDPSEGAPGDSVYVRVEGRGFSDGMDVSFDCPALELERISYVDPSAVYLQLQVAVDAEAQQCALTLGDRFGQQTVLPDAFTVALPSGPGEPDGGSAGDGDAGVDDGDPAGSGGGVDDGGSDGCSVVEAAAGALAQGRHVLQLLTLGLSRPR